MGHDYLWKLVPEDRRVYLECANCGHATAGFQYGGKGQDMQVVGIAAVVLGVVGSAMVVVAWRRLRAANRLLRSAMKLHDSYMEKFNIGGVDAHR